MLYYTQEEKTDADGRTFRVAKDIELPQLADPMAGCRYDDMDREAIRTRRRAYLHGVPEHIDTLTKKKHDLAGMIAITVRRQSFLDQVGELKVYTPDEEGVLSEGDGIWSENVRYLLDIVIFNYFQVITAQYQDQYAKHERLSEKGRRGFEKLLETTAKTYHASKNELNTLLLHLRDEEEALLDCPECLLSFL